MGEAADDMLEGRACQCCGEWFLDDEDCGYPRSCAGCLAETRREQIEGRKKGRVPHIEVVIKIDGKRGALITVGKKHAREFINGGDLTVMVGGYDGATLPKVFVSSDALEWFEKKDGK